MDNASESLTILVRHGVTMRRTPSAVLSSATPSTISFLTLILFLLLASSFLAPSALAQGSSRKMLPAAGENDQDQPQKRGEWNMRGRIAPKGESAAALRLRAHQQKMAMRAQRAAAETAQPQASATTWVSLGPSPLLSDATGSGGQDYNFVSGRATSVLIDPADTTGNTVFLGGAYGGLWKSTNAGDKSPSASSVVWTSLIDDQPSLAVGAIALQPGNSNVILVGTGEANASGDSYYGMGILRSTNGGITWQQITSAASGQSFLGIGFSKIAFSTTNTNLVVASTAGDIGFTFGLEQDGVATARGLYYSIDAGAIWHRVTLSDNAVAASATGVVYNTTQGAFYAAIRRHGIYSSTDGQHFTRLATQPTARLTTANCPAASNSGSCPIYRAEFAVTPGRNELYVWVVDVQLSEVDDGIWRTINGGTAWTQIPDTGITNCGDPGGCGVVQGTYDLELAAVVSSTATATDVYAGTRNIYKCTLTSNTQTACSQGNWLNLTHVYGCNPLGALAHVHPDQHGMAFMVAGGKSPGYFAHDGGISRTLDGYLGLTTGSCAGTNQFDSLSETLGSMTEFVSFSVHPTNADIMLGGTQDNGSPKTGTATSSTTWQNALGGDGGYNAINPTNVTEWFASNPGSIIGICEMGTGCDDNSTNLEAAPPNTIRNFAGNIDVGAFYTPYILDPQNSSNMLIGTCRIWRGTTNPPNGPGTFSTLSNNFDTLDTTACSGGEVNQVAALAAGGPKDVNGLSNVVYATTFGLGPFCTAANQYCGTLIPGGEVWRTTSASTMLMANVTGNINPKNYAIGSVAIDNADTTGNTAYVGIMGFHTSHVWKTTNAGTGWTDWTGSGLTGLPDAPVGSLLVDSAAHVVYAGTDVGLFSSPTTGAGGVWTEVGPAASSGSGFLPSAPVTAVQIFNNGIVKKLRVSTYGRGIWEFNLAVAPDFSNVISDSPQTVFPFQNATFQGTLTAQGAYNSPVNLSCTGTKPSTCTLNPAQVTPTGTYTVTAGGAVGDYSFNAHGVGTDAGTTTHDAAATLHVVDFALTPVSPNPVIVPQGLTQTATFQVTASGSFAYPVFLSCPSGLPAQATCGFTPSSTVNPTAANPVTVTLSVSTTGSTPQGTSTVTLQGITGLPVVTRSETFTLTVGPPPDFTWTTSSTSHTVLAGQTTLAYSFTATATGGATTFATNLTFACPSGLPDTTAVCVFSPTQINTGASSPQTVTLTITTKGPNPGTGNAIQRATNRYPWLPWTFPIVGVVMIGLAGRKVSKGSVIALLCVSLVLLGFMVACGGGSSTPPPPPPVSVTVTPNTTVQLYAIEAGNAWPANLTQQQFSAVVNNSANQTVTWAVTGGSANGSVDATGVYTTPATVPSTATVAVTATAAADATKSGSGTVAIQTPTTLGTFPAVSVTATEGAKSHSDPVTLIVQ